MMIVMTYMFPYAQCLSELASRVVTRAGPFHTCFLFLVLWVREAEYS